MAVLAPKAPNVMLKCKLSKLHCWVDPQEFLCHTVCWLRISFPAHMPNCHPVLTKGLYIAASSRYISIPRWPEIYHSHVLLHSRPSISVLCSCLRSHFVSCLYANMSCSAFYRGLLQSNAAIPMPCFWPRIHFVSYPYTNQSSDADLGLAIRAQS